MKQLFADWLYFTRLELKLACRRVMGKE